MSDRNRRILVWSLALAAVLLLGYAAFVVVLMSRGDYELGPVRILTVAANLITGALCVWGAWFFSRVKPPSG